MDTPVQFTPGLWKYEPIGLAFALAVDDFIVKHANADQALQLANALQLKYDISTDWLGSLHARVQLDWNYNEGQVAYRMPKNTKITLEKCNHPPLKQPQCTLFYLKPTVHRPKQQTIKIDTSKPLSLKGAKLLQSRLGTSQYKTCIID